jgi:hypothetical protein
MNRKFLPRMKGMPLAKSTAVKRGTIRVFRSNTASKFRQLVNSVDESEYVFLFFLGRSKRGQYDFNIPCLFASTSSQSEGKCRKVQGD